MVTDTTADTVNLNATSARPTRPEGESYGPPDEVPSPPLEGRRTGASDELSTEVPVDKSTTTQPTWTPRVKRPTGEVHGVAESHEEAAGGEVEGGEVGDEEGKVEMSTDMTAATTSAPSQSSMPPEGREGQDTTDNAGASVHQPLGAQTDSPRRRDGTTTSARDSAQPAKHADSTSVDHRQREDTHMNGRGGSTLGDVEDRREVQGDGTGGRQGNDDGAASSTSGGSRGATPKSLAEEEMCQCPERITYVKTELPEPPKPPDKAANRPNKPPSAELEGEWIGSANHGDGLTGDGMDIPGAPERNKDDLKRPTKLRNTSERVNESSKQRSPKYSPGSP